MYGALPANIPNWEGPDNGFNAHMDTVRDVPYQNIKPRVVENNDGGEILHHAEENLVLSPAEFPVLRDYVGKDLVVTDGTTLLGAGNRDGIAEI